MAELAVDAGSDRLIIEIGRGGIYQFEMCPATGENDGGCRVVYDGCSPNHTVEAARQQASACGEIATFSESVPFEMADITDGGSVDMSGVFAAAVGLRNRYDLQPTCEVSPCGADSCPDACKATAVAISCGREYQGRIEQFDTDDGWQLVGEFGIHVPQTAVCGEEHEKCYDDSVCMSDRADACGVACIDGY